MRKMTWATTMLMVAAMAAMGMAEQDGDSAKRDKSDQPCPQWKLATQAWTFNHFTLFETIDKAHKVGLGYIEIFPGQRISPENNTGFDHNASVAQIAKVKNKADKAGIKIISYGVVGIPKDEAGAREVFDFAKVMGITTINTEPEESQIEMLDKLANEYDINIGIHNHPFPSHYWKPEIVLNAIKGASPRMGACCDTGHWKRSGLDPIESLKKLEGRINSLHFKDVVSEGPGKGWHDVPWGTGDTDVQGLLKELDRQGYVGPFSIEYEYKWENNLPEVAKCVEWFTQQAKKLGKLCGK